MKYIKRTIAISTGIIVAIIMTLCILITTIANGTKNLLRLLHVYTRDTHYTQDFIQDVVCIKVLNVANTILDWSKTPPRGNP